MSRLDDAGAPHSPWSHTTVLLQEAVDAVFTRPDGCYVDGTFGRGGHARALLARLGPTGRVLAFDKDPTTLHRSLQMYQSDRQMRH